MSLHPELELAPEAEELLPLEEPSSDESLSDEDEAAAAAAAEADLPADEAAAAAAAELPEAEAAAAAAEAAFSADDCKYQVDYWWHMYFDTS